MKRTLLAALLVLLALTTWFLRAFFRPGAHLPEGPRTTDQVLDAIGSVVDQRLRPSFSLAGVPYPPSRIALLAFKHEKRLDVYASNPEAPYRFIRSYPILAASGVAGPKFAEGDCQVPEGFYEIESLNPNSRFHLSLRINYPNLDDTTRAIMEGRDTANLGGDIMIHGSNVSIGCLAMGDPASEDLFVLAARTGLDHIRILMAPSDFRDASSITRAKDSDERTAKLYRDLKAALAEFSH